MYIDQYLSPYLCGYRQKQPPEVLCKNGVLRNFAKFFLLIKLQILTLRPATLLKKRPWLSCLLVNFAKFLRTRFQQNTSWRLLQYRKGYSTQTALIVLLEKLRTLVDNKDFTRVVLMDSSEAFDAINHYYFWLNSMSNILVNTQ